MKENKLELEQLESEQLDNVSGDSSANVEANKGFRKTCPSLRYFFMVYEDGKHSG